MRSASDTKGPDLGDTRRLGGGPAACLPQGHLSVLPGYWLADVLLSGRTFPAGVPVVWPRLAERREKLASPLDAASAEWISRSLAPARACEVALAWLHGLLVGSRLGSCAAGRSRRGSTGPPAGPRGLAAARMRSRLTAAQIRETRPFDRGVVAAVRGVATFRFRGWLHVSGPVSVRWSPLLPRPSVRWGRSGALSDCRRRVRTTCEQPLILDQWTHALASSDLARPLEQRKRRNGERTGGPAD